MSLSIGEKQEARELILFTENDGELYRQIRSVLEVNLLSKIHKGAYHHDLGIKSYKALVEAGAKKYAREFAKASDWNLLFRTRVREAAQYEMARQFVEEARVGGFNGTALRVRGGAKFDADRAQNGIWPIDLIDILKE